MPIVIRMEQTRDKQRFGPFNGNDYEVEEGGGWSGDIAHMATLIPSPYDDFPTYYNMEEITDIVSSRRYLYAFQSLKQLQQVLMVDEEFTTILRRNKLRVYAYETQQRIDLYNQCLIPKEQAKKLCKIPFRVLTKGVA